MLALAERLLPMFEAGGIVVLSGELGVGKTTLVRGLLKASGYPGRVKSPTYGLLESYVLADRQIHHLDLYRLTSPDQLHELGLEELLEGSNLVLIEWPERAEKHLPPPTWRIHIDDGGNAGTRTILVR